MFKNTNLYQLGFTGMMIKSELRIIKTIKKRKWEKMKAT